MRSSRGLARDDRFVVAYADQLLRCGELLQGAQIAHRDRAVAAAIERLLHDVEYATAAGIAERYLDLPAGRGSRALAARLAAATALIASGDVGRGRSTLLAVVDEARAAGDQHVLADAILAAGPLTTGGHERRAVLDDAERLVATLPDEASSQRIQLACWAAHHWLLRGDRLRAEMLLATAEKDPRAGSDPVLEGLVLAIRAQADTLVEAGPEPARRSLDELRRFATIHPALSTRAAVCLLGGRDAWVHGAIPDVAAVGAELSAIAEQLPRPDVRWWPLALEASIELAVGQSERAATAIEAAARLGRQLKIDVAEPTALVQQLLLLLVNGELGSAAESLRPMAMSPGASAPLLAGYGLACVEAGAVDAVVEVAALLREDCRLLVSVGSAWPQVAMCASEIAAAAGDRALAQVLWTPLLRHRRYRPRTACRRLPRHGRPLPGVAGGDAGRCRRRPSAARVGDRAGASARRGGVGTAGGGRSRGSANSELAFVELSFDTTPGGVQQPIMDVERARSRLVRARPGWTSAR